ncbi:NADH-quinone oxidoreductase subunit NuoB [Candidimonas nitroreducens]|uniref:NADH:ubiquinone oxidoreductase n=1 Tax=Candidimonas nitroreducens TaxID=683354 RepID=A0A225MY53_9BURK|nr:NADH-quinone oxidoreductase subunit NuoB [Candidimonas nitroreducens]OWT66327.1 NADH:ubiquinone oxidoreductase [Candidimonas nitroreducens]
MPLWTLYGLMQGKASTAWPHSGDEGQEGVLGMPRYDPALCEDGCRRCVDACMPHAISLAADGAQERLEVDYGRCIVCQACVEACPSGAFSASGDWAFGVRRRADLVWAQALASHEAGQLRHEIRRVFGRSLHVRHVDAGSCNGCESELQALNNPFYNLHRLGIFFTPSPRFADLLLVTGPVTYAMRDPLLETYEAMPAPKFVMAMGTCAVSGGINGGGYACGNGLEGVLPVDIYLPGCPPNPAAIIQALLLLLGRGAQQVHAGRMDRGGRDG